MMAQVFNKSEQNFLNIFVQSADSIFKYIDSLNPCHPQVLPLTHLLDALYGSLQLICDEARITFFFWTRGGGVMGEEEWRGKGSDRYDVAVGGDAVESVVQDEEA
jgi:hypothetical protein